MGRANLNYFIANRFKAKFVTKPFLGQDLEINLVTVPTPDITLGEINIGYPTKLISYPGDSITYADIVLTFQIDEQWTEWLKIYEWIHLLKNCPEPNIKDYFANGIIFILDNKSAVVFEMHLEYCWPVNIMTVDLTTQIQDTSPIVFSTMIKYNNFTIKT